jgi:phosphoglucosamine mutase
VHVPDQGIVDRPDVREAIADTERRIQDCHGRLVIRPSGTEPVIRIMAEGDDAAAIDTLVGDLAAAIRDAGDPGASSATA